MEKASEKRDPFHGRKKVISRLRPPQITPNKFGFIKETCIAEKAEFEQLEKQSKTFCKDDSHKNEFKQWEGKLGDPVCIGGIKKGILRYFGQTKFADGIWCGIELEEPVGKNNGVVNGVQYFNCKENHGIFAPVSKVQHIPQAELSSNSQQSSSHQLSNYKVENFHSLPKFSYKNFIDLRRTSSPKETLNHSTFAADQESRTVFSDCIDKKDNSEQGVSFVLRRNPDFTKDSDKNPSISELNKCSNFYSDPFLNYKKEELIKNVQSTILIDKTEQSSESSKLKKLETNSNLSDKADINSTFTLGNSFDVLEATFIKNRDALNTTFDVDLSPINKNSSYKLSESCSKLTSNLNSTFILENVQENEKADELKENENMFQTDRKLSFEEAFDFDDIDDDQPSLDESLGILTPNQMKDFSIDQQAVIVFDGDTFRIPKMASCDNIDDIPEDEVKETLFSLNDPYTQILTENKCISESANLHSESKALMKSRKNISKINENYEFNNECSKNPRQTSTPYGNNKNDKSEFPSSPLIDPSEFNFKIELSNNFKSEIVENQPDTNEKTENQLLDKQIDFHENNNERKTNEIDQEEIPSCSFIHNITLSNQTDENIVNLDNDLKLSNDVEQNSRDLSKIDENVKVSNEHLNIQHISENIQIINSENHESNYLASNIQICTDTNVLIKSDVENLKIERPASTYTTGSTDTGYQEDGDFDVQSELSVAIPSPCSEIPAHSIYSSNRTMGIEDNEKQPIEMSDSDFFTDSGGIGFTTESEMETDGECKPASDFTVESNEMHTVIEQNSQNENQENTVLIIKKDDTLKTVNMDTNNESNINIPTVQTVAQSLIHEYSKDENGDKNILQNEITDSTNVEEKFQETEKSNSFIIHDKEEISSKENSSMQKHLLKNKTWIKTKELTKNKKDNILKTRTQNESFQNSEKKPKKNVVSKIKLMIETSVTKLPKNDENSQRSNRLPKKNRWDDVTSKIAASLAEEKSKVKTKREIRSRIDTNLTATTKIPSRRSSQIDSRRTSFSTENENTSIVETVTSKRIKNVQKNILSPSDKINSEFHDRENIQPSNIKSNPNPGKQNKNFPIEKTSGKIPSQTMKRTLKKESTPGKQPLLQKRPLFPNLDQRRPPLWASKTELSKEIQRLGALCEARTKELNLVKMQLKHAAAGFEAFSVLIKYMIEDLNAFSGPKVALEMKKTKEDLNKNLLQLRQYQNQIEDLKLNHAQEISNLTEKVSRIHNDELCDLKNKHSCELEEAKCHHEKKVLEMKELYEKTIYRNEEQYLKIMEELKDEYVKQKHELEQLHNKQLSNSILQHEKTQGQLIIQLKTLEQQYEELQEQAREVEETLKKSSDAKMQWLVSKKNDLEKEVESLKTVMEMKQSEIRTLRKENLEMKKELEELPLARDKIQKLRARKEELEALIEERSRAQSVLSTEHEQLKEHFEKESDINRKLAMEKEELQWKLQQSMETSSLLASLSESSSISETNSLPPTRLSSSFHSYSNTSEKSNSHHSLNTSTYKSYRRSSSLSETTLPSCKKLKQFWESSPVTGDNVRKIGIRSNSFLKPLSSQISKHPKHRSFTLQSGRSFADHIKSSDIKEEISKDHSKTEKFREKDSNDSEEIDKPQSSFISQNLSCDMISMEEDKSQFGKSLKWRFKLPKTEDTLPIKKLFENSVKNNHKKDEYKINHSLEQMDQSGKSLSPEFVVVLETSGNVAAYKTNTEQGDDAGLEESSKFSDSIEGSFISSQDGFDNSNNLSCSLQSSVVSDDSAWSNTSFPPHPHIDRTNQDFTSVSPSSEDDSFSNSSSGSPKNPNQIEEHGINIEQDESSSSAEQSQCIEENCQFRTVSPKSLAGEAMIQDDSPISVSQMSEEFSIPMPSKKHKKLEKLEITQECINKNSWEVTCVNKEKVISSNNAETPSMETTSQGLLMTNSNIDDISWDSEDMPSESEI